MGEILYYICIFPLEQVLGFILGLLFNLTQSHGSSIVILSFLVNIFMLKLFLYTDKKAASESALKAKLDSRIKAWKSVYKRAKLYAFTQTLYRQHNYHPIYALRSLGGLALQIPFFYAMYELIKGATYLSGIDFLWITDLSKPDSITLLGFSIHLLPILMTLFTLINVFYSSKELGARIQGSVIALLFLVLLYSMPSALVLYWTCNMVFALIKEVIKARFGNSSLTQSLNECGGSAWSLTPSKLPSPHIAQHSNLTQDTRIAESQKLNSQSSLRGGVADEAIHNGIGKATNTHFQINNAESKLDSKQMDCHADKSARNDRETFMQKARNDELANMDYHIGNSADSCEICCETMKPETKSQSSKALDYKTCHSRAIAEESKSTILSKMFCFTQHDKASKSSQTASYYTIIKLTIISLCLMIFLYNPYNLYSSDLFAFDLDSIPLTLSALFGFFALSSLLLMYIFSFLNGDNAISKAIMIFFAWLFVAVLILAVSYNFIFRGDYGVMSYFLFEKSVIPDNAKRYTDYTIITIFSLAAIPLLMWYRKYIVYVSKILILVLVIGSCISLVKSVSHIIQRHQTQVPTSNDIISKQNGLLDFAKNHNNILVLILDRSDGYVVHELFKQYPKLSESFQGFTDFTQTLSSSHNTLPTLTSIIAGEYYRASQINARNINDGLINEIARGYASTLNAFNAESYAVSARLDFPINEVSLYPFLDSRENIIFDTTFLLNAYIKENIPDSMPPKIPITQLISYGIFQSITYELRQFVYRGGAWLFTTKQSQYGYSHVADIYALTHYTTANATKPTFKFIHNSITHSPYVLNAQCKPNSSEIHNKYDTTYSIAEGHYNSEKCAWHFVAQMLDRLKELGVYDNTEIFITADHGAQRKFLPIKQNLHIPLFYKPLNAKGEMKQDNRIITNYDIPTIFCANLKNGCPNVAPNILANTQRRTIQTYNMGGGWNIHRQNKNSFKLERFYLFNGKDIYDKDSWQILDKDLKILNLDSQSTQSTHTSKDTK